MEVLNLVTMSSLELVEFINTERGADVPQLRHDHFMSKVATVLGEAAPKFLGTANYINGTGAEVNRAIYNLPKREACLMAMSYSYPLQAKVFDRMQELEAAATVPAKAALPPMTISEKYEQMLAAKRLVQDEQLKELFPLIWQEVSDGVQNDIVAMFGGQKRIQGPDATPLDIMEIAKREGIVVPANSKSVLGKHVKAQSSVAPVSIERIINGSVRSANAYTNHVEVASIIKKYLSRNAL